MTTYANPRNNGANKVLERTTISQVFFDLDGTLVDSAPSILGSIEAAFDQVGIKSSRPLTEDLIGSPLEDIMKLLVKHESLFELPKILNAFKVHYDEFGYRETKIYKHIPLVLNELKKMKIHLYIATNKRIAPTQKIIEYFGWSTLFDGVYALDCFSPPIKDKSTMLRYLHQNLMMNPAQSIYVGDRLEDGVSAHNNDVHFFLASWGYEKKKIKNPYGMNISSPKELLNKIRTLLNLSSLSI